MLPRRGDDEPNSFEELAQNPLSRFQSLMQKDSHRYEMLVLAVEASYLVLYAAFFLFSGDGRRHPHESSDFYESCVLTLWQQNLMRLESPAAEHSLRQRLFDSLKLVNQCDESLVRNDGMGDLVEDRLLLSKFLPVVVVLLRAWRLFGPKFRWQVSCSWGLDTSFHTSVVSWYGIMAGAYSNMNLVKVTDEKYADAFFIGPSIYVFLLTALCLTVLDQWQTLIVSGVSFSCFVIPQAVAIWRILEHKGPQLSVVLSSMNQLALLIAIVALCTARWLSWRDKQLDFRREEKLKTSIIDEKVKRCEAEFAATRRSQVAVDTDGESSYLYQPGAEPRPWHSPPSVQTAPASPDRLAELKSSARCDCLPMNAKVYLEGRPQAVPASELLSGDRLLCYDHLAGSIRFVEVNDCEVVDGQCDWSHIAMADGTSLSVTAEHPVRVVGEVDGDGRGAWGLGGGRVVPAGQLRPEKDMLKILRLGAVPVQSLQVKSEDQARVRVNLHQSWRYSLFCSQGTGVEMTAVAVESSDALDGRREADLQVQNTFIGGLSGEEMMVPRKPLSAPGAVTGGALRLQSLPEKDVYDPPLEDLETNFDSDTAGGADARASSASEDSPDQLHAKGCCKPCLFQSRYYGDPEKFPACTKPDCLAHFCHLPHSEEYITKYKTYKRRYEKKNRTAYRKHVEAL